MRIVPVHGEHSVAHQIGASGAASASREAAAEGRSAWPYWWCCWGRGAEKGPSGYSFSSRCSRTDMTDDAVQVRLPQPWW